MLDGLVPFGAISISTLRLLNPARFRPILISAINSS